MLKMKTKTTYTFHLMLKGQIMMNDIPEQYWDQNLRILSAKYTYEITKMSFQFNEVNLGKRNMYTQIKQFNRKWYTFTKIQMVPEEIQEKKDDKKGKKDSKKGGKQKPLASNQELEEQVKLVPKLVRELYEQPTSVQGFLEQTLLSFSEDYQDYVQRFVDTWKERIEAYLPFVETTQEENDHILSELQEQLEFWNTLRDINTGYQKIQSQFKGSPIYLEIICRFAKRLMESGTQPDFTYQCLEQFTELPTSEALQLALEINDLKKEAISHDIDWFPNMLGVLQEELETTKQGNEKAIQIFKNYFSLTQKLSQKLLLPQDPPKHQNFFYLTKFSSEFFALKAASFYLTKNPSPFSEQTTSETFFSVKEMSLQKVEIEIDQQQKWENQRDQEKLINLNQVFEFLASASVMAVQGKCWLQLINLAKFTYNLIVYQMLNPFLHEGLEIWKNLTLICLNILEMLKQVKENGLYPLRNLQKQKMKIRPEIIANQEKNNEEKNDPKSGTAVRFQEEEKNNLNQTENNENQEQQQYPFENPMLSDSYTKDPWFKKLDFDIELFANIIAYTIQSLMVEKKWNLLISISRDFCNLSDHQFSKYILHFTQYAQDILFQEAQEKTNQKEQELEAREKAFKEWQEKNKKKRSRQMQLTGEIPQEQQDFERDKQILLQQIQLLQNKEDFILSERERSQLVLDNIKRDSVKEILDLEEARKQLKDIGTIINEAIMTSPSKNFDSLDQNNNTKNLIKVQGQHCIKQYKTTADKLMAKKENFHCAQAKKELGSLSYVVNHYSSGSNSQILNSEEAWNEVIDLIFSQFQTVKQFRKVLASSPINTIAFNLGSRSILIAVNVLANLANISYYKDLHMARESIQFAAELVFSLFKISMPHPQILSKFGDYRLSQISLVEDIFQDKYAVDEVEIMASCEKLTWQLIDSEMSLKSLPLITISDYIATDLVKSDYYSARSKIVKAIALANCGQVNESYLTLQRIFNYKDLPNTWSQNTDYVKWEKGQNWHYNGEKFNNSIHPNEESNKQITEILLTKMELNLEFALKFGQTNYNIFNYAKSLLVYIINKNEIFESQEINEVRIQFLNQAEEQLRQNLQKISFEEEQEYLYFKLNKFNDNDREQEKIKEEIEYNFGIRGLNPQEAEDYFQNREENIDYYQKRQERHVLIARIRYLLSQISVSQNLFHRGFLIIKQGIKNLINYAQEERNVETGKEPEVEEIDKLKPQDEPAGKGGKKEAPQTKKEDKKAGKQDKNAAGLQEERERIEKQRQEQLQLDIQENKKTLEYQRFRRHLSSFWILKLKTELVEIMYKQNRHQEALSLIRDVILPDCDMYRDVYFKRILKEIEGRILVKTGQYVEGITNFEWCIKWASINKQVDYKHVQMLGDYGEILYERSHYDQALQIYNTALKFAEQLLQEQNYDCYPKNFYEKAFKEGVQTCQEMFTTQEQEEEILTKQERVSAQVTGKGGKKDDKKKDDKKKGDKKQQKGNVEEEKPEMKVSPLNPLKETDYYNDEQKNTYQIIELEKTNNTKIVYNLYINHVVLYIKTVLRWVDCVLSTQRIEEKSQMSFENILKLLNKVEQMRDLSKNFLVPISLRLELNYMYAKFYKRKFEDGLNQITNKYIDVFLKGKNDKNEEIKENAKKYKKLFARKPYRDFARNRYLLEVPNFSQQLKENLIPLIEEAKKHYESAITLFSRGECLWFEHNRNIDDIFVELTEICLYKREYNPRVGYKYIDEDEFQQQVEFKKEFNTELKGQDTNVKQHIENLQKTEDNEKIKLENDAFKNMVYAVEISKIKQDLQQDYHNIANQPLTETNKIPTDIFYEIIEQDYLCKKDYNEIITYPMQLDEHIQLFDENKKKINIQTIDLLMILIKYFNESKIMTFNQNEIQIKISKLHRYLKKYLPIYSQKCIIPHIESLGVIQQGNIVIKSLPQPASNEYKLIYLFAGLDKAQIKSNLSQEEIQKIIINEEQNLVYGNIYVSLQDCDEQLQKCLDLRTKMIETDQHSQAIKDRDYANYKKIFLEIIETFGKFFQLSDLPSRKKHNEENNQQQNINKPNILVQNVIQEEEEESEVLQKYIAFVPELNYETIDIFIRIYGQKGLSTINISQQQQQSQQNTGNNNQKSQPSAKGKGGKNQQQDQQQQSSNKEVSKGPAIINHNILALFRYFHSQKYK
ncbi:hypothetical protein PPERSA_07839 [Pseudocohnilembus persalinus]|uniref:Uncharacterized protein n=1 Tax=Pseudocohnilembus persalinus TaxID=266149 RepID=A0A0V0QC56_PSEPJ|nr:hypothetical protein PPERSA_07839 [Pseudocohnilembus persalinus]|eukprot:KRW99762.1 hypothetical protein PPERSA_07839 [Pseudocohnilembus persalinus]